MYALKLNQPTRYALKNAFKAFFFGLFTQKKDVYSER